MQCTLHTPHVASVSICGAANPVQFRPDSTHMGVFWYCTLAAAHAASEPPCLGGINPIVGFLLTRSRSIKQTKCNQPTHMRDTRCTTRHKRDYSDITLRTKIRSNDMASSAAPSAAAAALLSPAPDESSDCRGALRSDSNCRPCRPITANL